jgi:hypothetical protein
MERGERGEGRMERGERGEERMERGERGEEGGWGDGEERMGGRMGVK